MFYTIFNGSYSLTADCQTKLHIAVTGTLEINGTNTNMSELFVITAAANKRHFYVNDANAKLILRFIKLTGEMLVTIIIILFIVVDQYVGPMVELDLYSSIVLIIRLVWGEFMQIANITKNVIMIYIIVLPQ